MTEYTTVRRTFKYRLYRSKHDKHLVQAIDIAGLIWNHSLALNKRYYRRYSKSLSFYRLQKHIAKLRMKTERYAHWQKLGSQAVQDVILRFEKAFNRFLIRQGGFPRFKKVKLYRSFTLTQAGWKLLDGNKIRILGRTYKYVKSRPLEGMIKTVTIKRDNMGRLWVAFSLVMKVPTPEPTTSKIGGFDFGLKHFLTNDEGLTIESPLFFAQAHKQVAALNQELSRKVKGSNNRKRVKRRLAKAYGDIANKRRDWFYKLSHNLCDEYSVICIEDLNIKGMQRVWGRKVSDLAFSEFVSILEHVAQKRGVAVKKIDRWTPTSKVCSSCGSVFENLTLADRTLYCDCGLTIDRDHNAAINIKKVGASTYDLEVIRPSLADNILA